MRCWYCAERDETSEFGLCRVCRDVLETETLIPPGRFLHPHGTLPEEIGPYHTPSPSVYRTTPY